MVGVEEPTMMTILRDLMAFLLHDHIQCLT